jgi:hypothetical protein
MMRLLMQRGGTEVPDAHRMALLRVSDSDGEGDSDGVTDRGRGSMCTGAQTRQCLRRQMGHGRQHACAIEP